MSHPSVGKLNLPRQTRPILIKVFCIIVVAFSAAIILTVYTIRPVVPESGISMILPVCLTQDLLKVQLRDKSVSQMADYLRSRNDPLLSNAQIISVSELLQPESERKYGLCLLRYERDLLLLGLPFRGGMWSNFEMSYQSHLKPDLNYAALSADRQNEVLLNRMSDFSQPPLDFSGIQITWKMLVQYASNLFYKTNMDRSKGRRYPFVVIPIRDSPYAVYARRPASAEPEIPLLSFFIGIGGSLCILIAAACLIIFPIVVRIRRIQHVCTCVENGDYTCRCGDNVQDSIGILAQNIDHMIAAIDHHLAQQKSLLQAVSHEIRTPLARMRFTKEMIDIAPDDEKSMAKLDSIDDDIDEIEDLLKELSYFNYINADKRRELIEENDINDMLKTAFKQRSQAIEKFSLETVGLEEGMTVSADRTAFVRVIGNLLSNAARYAKTNIVVRVRPVRDGDMIEIGVEDDGIGIPEDKRREIFEPFVCLDPSRSKSLGGVGLGLAICARIMVIHHGRIWAETSPSGGARFVTLWPKNQE